MSLPAVKKNFIGNYLIFLQSLVAILGSLYFEHFGDLVENMQTGSYFDPIHANPPCYLCWWSRIILYPIVWFSFIGLVRKDPTVVESFLWVSLAGILFSGYQYYYEWLHKEIYVQYFGFITMPLLAGVAFLVICILCLVVKRQLKK
ncbi:MAG: disulfide bond formation protein B [bacterium]